MAIQRYGTKSPVRLLIDRPGGCPVARPTPGERSFSQRGLSGRDCPRRRPGARLTIDSGDQNRPTGAFPARLEAYAEALCKGRRRTVAPVRYVYPGPSGASMPDLSAHRPEAAAGAAQTMLERSATLHRRRKRETFRPTRLRRNLY